MAKKVELNLSDGDSKKKTRRFKAVWDTYR
jgi:hypothetical protein